MSGTLYGLGLSQQTDINGRPLSGCLLYLYAATTSSPVTAYQDYGLTVMLPNPLEADSTGRIPQFWLPDGTYRARLTTSAGIEVFDFDSIAAIGPSVSTTSGGGTGTAVDPTAIYQTGDPLWVPVAGTRSGWIRMNGRTFGSASSGGAERANADTQALYEYIWNGFSDTLCPVTGGRGVSAAADFLANKSIATLDMRDRGPFGLGDMGNSDAGLIVGGTPTVAGSSGGLEKSSITIAQANIPSYNLDISGINVKYDIATNTTASSGATRVLSIGSTGATTSSGGLTGTLSSGGSDTAITPTTISPYRLGTWFIKL